MALLDLGARQEASGRTEDLEAPFAAAKAVLKIALQNRPTSWCVLHAWPVRHTFGAMAASPSATQDDVGSDPVSLAVVDGLQVDDLPEVAPAALDFQELLIAEADVLGSQARVGGAEHVLAVQVLLGLDLFGVDAEEAAGVTRRKRFGPRLAG